MWLVPGQEAVPVPVSQCYLERQHAVTAPVVPPIPPCISAHLWDRWCPVFPSFAGSEWQTAPSSMSVLIPQTNIDQPGDI